MLIRNISLIVIITVMILIFPYQVIAKQNNFSFPKSIVYKIIKQNRILGSTLFRLSKKGERKPYRLTMSDFKGFGFNLKVNWVSEIKSTDFSLIASYIVNNKKQHLQEFYFKAEKGLLGNSIFIHKSMDDNSTKTITEVASPYTVIDFLSSFLVLSKKVSVSNDRPERYNLFIGKTTYIVDSSVEKNIFYSHKNQQKNTSKVTLKYFFDIKDNSAKQKGSESIDLVVFYIYNDIATGVWYPICIKIEDENGEKYELIADKIL